VGKGMDSRLHLNRLAGCCVLAPVLFVLCCVVHEAAARLCWLKPSRDDVVTASMMSSGDVASRDRLVTDCRGSQMNW